MCAESKVSDRRHLSEVTATQRSHISVRHRGRTELLAWLPQTVSEELQTWCPGYGTLCNGRIPLLPAEQVGNFLPRVLCVRICSWMKNNYVYTFYRNPGYDGSLYDCLLDISVVQSVDDKAVFVFVSDANAHHS